MAWKALAYILLELPFNKHTVPGDFLSIPAGMEAACSCTAYHAGQTVPEKPLGSKEYVPGWQRCLREASRASALDNHTIAGGGQL